VRPTANPNAELTARQLAAALDVTPQLVNRWHTDGYLNRAGERVYLAAVGRNRLGHRLFRYLDGAIAEAATRQSPKSYRKPVRRPASGAGSWAERDHKPTAQFVHAS
jgi:hypothetical protein